MDKNEMKIRISFALRDPVLQQGFECICKENADLKIYNEKLYRLINAERKRQEECDDIHLQRITELEKENAESKEIILKLYNSERGGEMVEHYKHILDEITVPDILTYLCARVSQEEDELRRRRNADVTYMKNCSTCKHLAKPFNLCCYSLGDEDYDCNGKKWEGIEND